MPLSRQTSRIVWPSKPSTTRPSTSIRMRGVDTGRCGAWVVSSSSARDGVSSIGSVRVIRSAMRDGASVRTGPGHRDRVADAGGAGAVEDVLIQLGAEVSHSAGEGEGGQALVIAQP